MGRFSFLCIFGIIFVSCAQFPDALGTTRSLTEYGAISGCDSVACAAQNGASFHNAALASQSGDTVLVNPGENFLYLPSTQGILENISGVNFLVEGNITLHNNYSAWPEDSESNYLNAFHFRNGDNILFTGNGTIDGQGEEWWRAFFLGKVDRQRPTILYFEDCYDSIIEQVYLMNAPRFNVYGCNVEKFVVRKMTIWIDTSIQSTITSEMNGPFLARNVPMFPYNTDGVDVHGKDIHLHDLTISNFDDAVAVKSSHSQYSIPCTKNVTVERIHVLYGVGLSVGSVPPNQYHRCVRDVTFRDIIATDPIKFIYVKTNLEKDCEPNCTGLIENIYYENMLATNTLLWPIYIGPQQQRPNLNQSEHGTGTGDGIWPNTEPRVTIRNITLKNINAKGSLSTRAGVLRCNISNPCTNFLFDNVQVTGQDMKTGDGAFICDDPYSVVGTYDPESNPDPSGCIMSPKAG